VPDSLLEHVNLYSMTGNKAAIRDLSRAMHCSRAASMTAVRLRNLRLAAGKYRRGSGGLAAGAGAAASSSHGNRNPSQSDGAGRAVGQPPGQPDIAMDGSEIAMPAVLHDVAVAQAAVIGFGDEAGAQARRWAPATGAQPAYRAQQDAYCALGAAAAGAVKAE
jgi:hypothetical protein